ncbi:aspartate-semialdehyde dehydrogenase [Sesbania bispinosa]|nr:aspartate-semialdehyde dehydrogenase [Sesbania bispinosa]
MASEVTGWGSATAEDVEVTEMHSVIVATVACGTQTALALVLAPIHANACLTR